MRQAPPAARRVLRALVTAQTRHNLFLPEQNVIVAVSGGADSLCLLHALHRLAPYWRLSLHVAHLDHALRPDSADDARFVAGVARQLSLPFYSDRLTPGILQDVPGGIEGAARSARVGFLRQIATQLTTQLGAPVTIATAHHQDDQAETLLMHLLQGSGLTGLAGMAWVGQLPDAQEPPLRLVRPLLSVSREQLHAYLRTFGLEWREDSSNLDTVHLRNQLRHQVLPLLATINPNIHATLARTADLLAAEADHATNRDRATLAAVTLNVTHQTRLVVDLFRLTQYDLATQRGALRLALLSLGVDLRTVGMEGIEALLEQARAASASGTHPLLAGWAWTRLHLSTSVMGEGGNSSSQTRRNDVSMIVLSLHRADVLPIAVEHPHISAPLPTPLPLPIDGTLTMDGWQLHSSVIAPDDLPPDWRSRHQQWQLFCDAEQSGDLYLTTFQAGMSIAPLGMAGHQRSLGDIFTDYKIPPYLRPGWPIVVKGDGTVVWLCGLVVAESVRIQPTTRQVRRLLWQREREVSP